MHNISATICIMILMKFCKKHNTNQWITIKFGIRTTFFFRIVHHRVPLFFELCDKKDFYQKYNIIYFWNYFYYFYFKWLYFQ